MADNQIIAKKKIPRPLTGTIEEGLAFLLQYGHPRLGHFGDGSWSCSIEMYVNQKEIDFKISSGFMKSTPNAAVYQCIDNLAQALKALGLDV